MKKILPVFLAVFLLFPSIGKAQAIYNSSGDSTYSPLYNSSGAYTGGGPISLKQLLEGNKEAATGRKSSTYYGGGNFRPYGVNNNSYSLSLSPAEVQESRARRDALAQQRERASLAALDDLQFVPIEGQTDQLLNQFQSNGSSSVTRRKVTSKYKQREDNFETPKKVFNSIY